MHRTKVLLTINGE